MKTPLRRRILLYSSSLLIVLIVAMLVYVDYQAERFVDERINSDLEQGRERIRKAEEERIRNLRLTAGVVGSLPTLSAALSTKDTGTVRDFLSFYQQQHGLSELIIVLDPSGHVVVRTDTSEPVPVPEELETGILKTDRAMYHVARMPAEAGGTIFGSVIAGAPIDDEFARGLHEISNDDIVIVGETVLGSSLSRSALPWQTRAEWEAMVGKDPAPRTINVDNQNFSAVATLFGTESGPRPLAIIMQSHDKAIAPYRRIQVRGFTDPVPVYKMG